MEQVKAIIDIDVVNIYTGEVIETYEQVWLGDYEKIYNSVASSHTVNKVERDGDLRTIWVQE